MIEDHYSLAAKTWSRGTVAKVVVVVGCPVRNNQLPAVQEASAGINHVRGIAFIDRHRKTLAWGYPAAPDVGRSDVNVAMPHLRGK